MQGLGALPVPWRGFDAHANLFTIACDVAQDIPLFPDLGDALAYWAKKCAGHAMPGRQDIDPADMTGFLPRIMLADLEHRPLRFRYRVAGTGVCHVHEGDATGLCADQLQPPQYGRLVHAQYAGVAQSGRPALHLNLFDNHAVYHSYAHIILPLARNHVSVDMILTVDSLTQDQAKMMNMLMALQSRDGVAPGAIYAGPEKRTT